MKVVVLIPTFNEAENIGRMLDVLVKEEFPKIKGHEMQILVIDSKSPDGTANIVKEKIKSYSVSASERSEYKQVFLLETEKGGLGADYVKGMKYAIESMKADAVIELDADFQHDPKDVKRLVKTADKGADHVIGSRYIKGGAIPKEWEFHRKMMSFFGSLFARLVLLMFGVHDMTSGLKLSKTEFLKKVDLDNLYSKYYAYKIQITYELAKLGASIVEIPIIFYERREGTSKISRKDLVDSFLVVLKLRIRDSKRFIKFGIVGFIGYMINAFGLEIFANMDITKNLANNFAYLRGGILNLLSERSAWAAAFAAECAILSNFTFNNFWTFASDKITEPVSIVKKFLEFNLTSFGAVLIQFAVIGIAVILFSDRTLVRQLALIFAIGALIIPYNYIMYNIFIWKRWKPSKILELIRGKF